MFNDKVATAQETSRWAQAAVKINQPHTYIDNTAILKNIRDDERVVTFLYQVGVDQDRKLYYGVLVVYFSAKMSPQFIADTLFATEAEVSLYLRNVIEKKHGLTKYSEHVESKDPLRKNAAATVLEYKYDMGRYWFITNTNWALHSLVSIEFAKG